MPPLEFKAAARRNQGTAVFYCPLFDWPAHRALPDCRAHSHIPGIMLYMVIEHFREGAAPKIYERFREKGRMMPEELKYVSSWISHDLKTCWQVMDANDPSLFGKWTRNWNDLMDFEIVPIYTSSEMREKFNGSSPQSSP